MRNKEAEPKILGNSQSIHIEREKKNRTCLGENMKEVAKFDKAMNWPSQKIQELLIKKVVIERGTGGN